MSQSFSISPTIASTSPIAGSKSKFLLNSFSGLFYHFFFFFFIIKSIFILIIESISNTASKLFKNPFRSQPQNTSDNSLLKPVPAKRHYFNDKRSKEHSQLKRNSNTLSLRNIIRPIALRPTEYETYLLTKNFFTMKIDKQAIVDCSNASSIDFKSSTLSLPIITKAQEMSKSCIENNISMKKHDLSKFERLYVSQSATETKIKTTKTNRLKSKSPYLLISSQNFVKKKRRLDLDYDNCRPYINLQKMKSKLVNNVRLTNNETDNKSSCSSSNLDDDDDYDDEGIYFIDEGIDSENQSAYSSTSSFYSNSYSASNEHLNLNTQKPAAAAAAVATVEATDDSSHCQKSSHYSNIKFIDIDLNQIENDLHF